MAKRREASWAEWMLEGYDNGWLGTPFCYVHGGPELTDEEEQILNETEDMDALCITVARLYEPSGMSDD
jgi:hypothetical protein